MQLEYLQLMRRVFPSPVQQVQGGLYKVAYNVVMGRLALQVLQDAIAVSCLVLPQVYAAIVRAAHHDRIPCTTEGSCQ